LLRAHLHKRGLREFLVDCTQRGSEQFRRREGELVALARCSGLPGTIAVESLASTPCTRQLSMAGAEAGGDFSGAGGALCF
jgi:hypothetical protein